MVVMPQPMIQAMIDYSYIRPVDLSFPFDTGMQFKDDDS